MSLVNKVFRQREKSAEEELSHTLEAENTDKGHEVHLIVVP